MVNHEEAFAEEAQEEALLSENPPFESGIDTQFHVRDDDELEDETSPLVSPLRRRTVQRTPYARARSSYERAISEPWNGAHGAKGLPWWKAPSVCSYRRQCWSDN